MTLAGATTSYTYDAAGRLTSVTDSLGGVFELSCDAAGNLVSTTDPMGRIARFTYDAAGRVTSLDSDAGPALTYAYDAAGRLVTWIAPPCCVTTYAYDPWGALLSENETVANPYRYASYRYDSATGLYYCWNRYYAPELARFLTRDIYPGELADPVTMNPYLYCGGDPVNRVDPSGLLSINSWKAIGLGVAAVGLGIASVALIVGSGGAAAPLVAAAALSLGGMIAAGWSLDTTERQWQAGEISPAEYKTQKTLGWWGMGVSAASGAAACAGAPAGVQAYMAVHGLNVATVGLTLSSAQALKELTR